MAAPADIATKIRVKAIAWLAKHHDVTLGDCLVYVATINREHWPVVVEAWHEHGLSVALVDVLVERFRKRQEAL